MIAFYVWSVSSNESGLGYEMACGNNRLILDVKEEVASSNRLTGYNSVNTLRTNFVSLKRKLGVHIQDISNMALRSKFLTADEPLQLRMFVSDIDKIDFLLKCILRKSKECLELFMKYILDKDYIRKQDLQEDRFRNADTSLQMFRVSDFAKDEVRDYLRKELEVIGIVDYLFEWYLIDLEEHANILESNPRSSQVQSILDILQRRDESWLHTFCYILKQHAHPRIIGHLKCLKECKDVLYEDDDIPGFSSTIKIHAEADTEDVLMLQSISQLNNFMTDDDLTVVATRNGCVEFILVSLPDKDCLRLSTSAQEAMCLRFLQNLISMPSVKQTVKTGQTFRITLQRYDKSLPLIGKSEGTKQTLLDNRLAVLLSKHSLLQSIDVLPFINVLTMGEFIDENLRKELLETKNEKLKREYLIYFLSSCEEYILNKILSYTKKNREMESIVDEIEKWRCLECYRKSIIDAYIEIEDDIDTDIIQKTLQNQKEVPVVITHICVDQADKLSRVKRASIFLQYLLANEDILLSFAIEFSRRSRLVLKHSLCDNCSSRPKEKNHGIPNSVEFNFITMTNKTGELLVCSNGLSDIRSTIQGPYMKSEEDAIRLLLFGKSTKRTQFIMNILPKEIQQRLAEQTDEKPTVKRQRIGHQHIICAEMPDLTVRSSALENVIAKLTAKIAPGPHIIMVVLGVSDENPMEALRELKDFFGDDILKHILLVFIAESFLDLNKTKSLNHFIEHKYRSVLTECNNHYIAVPSKTDNTSIKIVQDQFATTIEQITKRNNMRYFTNENIKNIETAILNYMDEMTNHLYNESVKEKTKMLQEIDKEETSSEKVLDLRKKAIDDLLYIDSLQNFNSRTLAAAKNMLSEFEMRTRKSLELP